MKTKSGEREISSAKAIDSNRKKSIFAQRIALKNVIESTDLLFGDVLSNVVERDLSNVAERDASLSNRVRVFKSGFPTPVRLNNCVKIDDNLEKLSIEQFMELEEITKSLEPSKLEFLKKRAAKRFEPLVTPSLEDKDKVMASTLVEKGEFTARTSVEKKGEFTTDSWNEPPVGEKGETRNEENGKSTNEDLVKLAWTFQETATEKSSIQSRFDFAGKLIDPEANLPTYHGLHHHGDQPSNPGYTISELVHLSKSTVPTQRCIALSTLSKIIQNVYQGDLDKKYIFELREHSTLLSIRINIDESHYTVISDAIACLSTFLGCHSKTRGFNFDDLQSKLLLSGRMKLLSTSAATSKVFSSRALGRKSEPELPSEIVEMNDILQAMDVDYIAALMATNLTVRFHYLFSKMPLDLDDKKNIIKILIRFAQHSSSAAEEILATRGLVDVIHKYLMELDWNDISTHRAIIDCLRLYKHISISSRKACKALVDHQIVGDILRFLSLYANNILKASSIMIEVFQILAVAFSYCLGGSILDEYRSVLIEICRNEYTKSEKYPDTLVAIFNCARIAYSSFRPEMDAGGFNDALFPIIDLCSKEFQQCDPNTISSCADLLRVYVDQCFGYQEQVSDRSLQIMDILKTLPLNFEVLLQFLKHGSSTSINECPDDEFEKGIGHVSTLKEEYAYHLLNIGSNYEFGRSILQLLQTLVSRKLISLDIAKTIVTNEILVQFVEDCINSPKPKHDDVVKVFNSQAYFLEAWLSCCKYFKFNHVLIQPAAIVAITEMVPGDDILASKILNGNLLDGYSQDYKKLFSELMFNREALQKSQALYSNNNIDSLLIELDEHSTTLPTTRAWIYAPFTKIFFEQKDNQKTLSNNQAETIIRLLQFIHNLESGPAKDYMSSIDSGVKLVAFMHIFLLSDDFFSDERVSKFLDWGYKTFATKNVDLQNGFSIFEKTSLASQSRLYEFYQELVRQYLAVSFGNELFSKYLCLPLTTAYPEDYRIFFWTSMGKMLRSIVWREEDLPEGDITPFLQKETSENLKSIYQSVLDRNIVTEANPVLYAILKSLK